ncbi:hypothetical protein ABB37_04270 [Leptomonas pyrrhocoris]|uniref:Uncharacterized protein n=1 Tax=Leptomonas pyrrhocoris TaxID=157538 RepID=A0A0M9G2G2_LEPPY|nr:hypothetical protein ABB37_04270 [Leptomonas pyrrhocoris]KPA80847.1 hypothetical protein ABB37_04270 [Leptomonas pyrrhocoris]|eukprot:XP_015659286.1 hypothetical protein ABB37_04270 [Leptomonas pyrrhocoris]
MQCVLSGASSEAESMLQAARQRWGREREASHLRPAAPIRYTTQQQHDNGNSSHKTSARGGEKGEKMTTPCTENAHAKTTKAAALITASEPVQGRSGSGSSSVEGGQGLLFVDAVFEGAVPDSFDRHTPWQLEIVLYFTA